MKIVITHFYNEEYLLPWWLEHHKKYFDHGILIDYGSTDRSVEIVRDICPNWQIFNSPYSEFDQHNLDREVEFYENQFDGWRIALTVTEFLVGNLKAMMHDQPYPTQYSIPMIRFAEYNPEGKLLPNIPLWEQCETGINYLLNANSKFSRSLHNYKGMIYQPGRHFWGYDTEELAIFKFSECLIGPEMIKRKLQIQHKVSQRDRQIGIADQHLYRAGGGLTEETLPNYFKENLLSENPTNCSEIIKKITSLL